MEAARAVHRPLTVLESVVCLECGETYSKPNMGGTTQQNPGCPVCAYVGWIPVTVPESRRRSVVGRRLPRACRPR